MALKILMEEVPKGTIAREKLAADIARAKADPNWKPNPFICKACGNTTPLSEVGHRYANGTAVCKACHEVTTAKVNGTWRGFSWDKKTGKKISICTIDSVRRSSRKATAKKYVQGKLPKWMFS